MQELQKRQIAWCIMWKKYWAEVMFYGVIHQVMLFFPWVVQQEMHFCFFASDSPGVTRFSNNTLFRKWSTFSHRPGERRCFSASVQEYIIEVRRKKSVLCISKFEGTVTQLIQPLFAHPLRWNNNESTVRSVQFSGGYLDGEFQMNWESQNLCAPDIFCFISIMLAFQI